MTTVRATTRLYDPETGNLVKEVEVEVTTPAPAAPPAKSNVVALRTSCAPGCTVCAALAAENERQRLFAAARSFGFGVRYTPPPTPTAWLRYSSPITTEFAGALSRVFV
jgi:hypothetical protein